MEAKSEIADYPKTFPSDLHDESELRGVDRVFKRARDDGECLRVEPSSSVSAMDERGNDDGSAVNMCASDDLEDAGSVDCHQNLWARSGETGSDDVPRTFSNGDAIEMEHFGTSKTSKVPIYITQQVSRSRKCERVLAVSLLILGVSVCAMCVLLFQLRSEVDNLRRSCNTCDIKDGSVGKEKLGSDVAGPGLKFFTDHSLQIASGEGLVVDLVDRKIHVRNVSENLLGSGSVSNRVLAFSSVGQQQLRDGSITTHKLADGSVVGSKLGNNTVSTAHLKHGCVLQANIANNSVLSQHIVDGSITSGKVANNAIASQHIVDGSITSGKVANDSIASQHIVDGSITSGKVANDSIASQHIVDGSITSGKIANNAIATRHLVDESVTGMKLANNSVSTRSIDENAVTGKELHSSVAGSGLRFADDGSLETFVPVIAMGSVERADMCVNAGDVVTFGKSGRVSGVIGPSISFVDCEYPSIVCMGETSFVAVCDIYVFIGDVNGSVVSYGSPMRWSHNEPVGKTVIELSSTTFIIAYYDSQGAGRGIYGTLSGGKTLTFGAETTFNGGGLTTNMNAVKMTDTSFVIAYRDGSNSNYGTAVLGTISGALLSFGPETVFKSGRESHYILRLSAISFVIAYQDAVASYRGRAVLGSTSSGVLSFGPEVEFRAGHVDYFGLVRLDDSSFVIAFRDLDNLRCGAAVLGSVSAGVMSFNVPFVFNAGEVSHVGLFGMGSATTFLVAYRNVGDANRATALIGSVSGGILSFATPAALHPAEPVSMQVEKINDTMFIMGFRDSSKSGSSVAALGVVSGNSITFVDKVTFLEIPSQNCDIVLRSNSEYMISCAHGVLSSVCGRVEGNELVFPAVGTTGVVKRGGCSGDSIAVTLYGPTDFTTQNAVGSKYYETSPDGKSFEKEGRRYVGLVLSSTSLYVNF